MCFRPFPKLPGCLRLKYKSSVCFTVLHLRFYQYSFDLQTCQTIFNKIYNESYYGSIHHSFQNVLNVLSVLCFKITSCCTVPNFCEYSKLVILFSDDAVDWSFFIVFSRRVTFIRLNGYGRFLAKNRLENSIAGNRGKYLTKKWKSFKLILNTTIGFFMTLDMTIVCILVVLNDVIFPIWSKNLQP
jgi:hypothetical protein